MTLNRPYNIDIVAKAIDAAEDNTFYWDISGDVQTAYQVDIYKNSDSTSVFSTGKITSYNLYYKIPKNTLTNGMEYKLTVKAFNASNENQTSYAVVFQTSARPVITINTIGTVSNFSNLFSATYTQAQSVPLQSWNANLYNSDKVLIDHSDIMTDSILEYLFANLETEKSYYIEFQATSETGLTGTCGLVKFSVFYLRPKQNVNLSAKNIDNAGIELSWYVAQILGKSSGTISYLNDEINLLNGKVSFDEGFNISQDFSLKVWLHGVENYVTLLSLNGENGKMFVIYNPILESFVLTKISNTISDQFQSNGTTVYTFISPYQVVEQTGDKVCLLIQQIGSDINIEITMYD
jgi:hypothetical protein